MNRAALVGSIGLVLSAIALVFAPAETARAWLSAAVVALGFPLGALMILMVDNMTGGRWGEGIRPVALAMAGTLPLALLLFVPLLFVMPALFPWAADPGQLSVTAQNKLPYLNPTFQALRFVASAVLWLLLAFALGVWRGGVPRFGSPAAVSALGFALHALIFTIFATDWMQALEPDFYSTIYPMLAASEELVVALAAAILLLPRSEARPGGAPKSTLGEDLAGLLAAAMFFWGYLAFMQWIVIWSGNLPDEIGWYLKRINGGWLAVLWVVLLLGFVVPFVGLVSRRGKRDPRWLAIIVSATLIGHLLGGIWRIAPAFPPSFLLLVLLVPAALAIGGSGFAMLAWLKARLPVAGTREAADAPAR